MKLGFVLREVPERSWCWPSMVDAEWLTELASQGHGVEVYVDHDGPGADLCRSSGVSVFVSAKRVIEDERRITSDRSQCLSMARSHRQAPFSALFVAADVAVEPGWLVEELSDVPLGVAVGGPQFAAIPSALEDPLTSENQLRELWAIAGACDTADFWLGYAPPQAFGLETKSSMPLIAPGAAVEFAPGPVGPVSLCTVVASVPDRGLLSSLGGLLGGQVAVGPSTTVVVVTPDVPLSDGRAGDFVHCALPEELSTATIVVHSDWDGAAHAFLERSDHVFLTGPADLAIPAIRELVASGRVSRLTDFAIPLTGELTEIPAASRRGETLLLADEGDPVALATMLEQSEADAVILHSSETSDLARRLLGWRFAASVDAVVIGEPGPVHGTPSVSKLVPGLIGLRGGARHIAARVLRDSPSLWDFQQRVLQTDNVSRLSVRVLPAEVGDRALSIATVSDGVGWFGRGPLPLIKMIPTAAKVEAKTTRRPEPAVVDARTWARRHRWSDRVRMALPFKFGLLDRAMRGRW